MEEFARQYGMLALAVAGTLGGWYLGLKQAQWAITQFTSDIQKLETRVSHLETQGSTVAATLSGMSATLRGMDSTLTEIKTDLRGKADK